MWKFASRGSIVVAGFGRRTAICLRGAWRSLYRECTGLCGTRSRDRRAALCGTGCFIRRAGLWGTRLRGTWTGVRSTRLRGTWTGIRSTRLRRTGAHLRSAGLWATGACLRGSCLLWVRQIGARRTASLCRAGARLPISLCGRIRAKATCGHPLQRWWSLYRQSRLRSVGILQLRQRRARAKGRFKPLISNGPGAGVNRVLPGISSVWGGAGGPAGGDSAGGGAIGAGAGVSCEAP